MPTAIGARSAIAASCARAPDARPVVGVVTMDMTMIDVTDVPCGVGDVATLIGADGDDRIDVERSRANGRA